jgi:hypothetical protein
MQELTFKEKRIWLSKLSRTLKPLVETGEADSVNDALLSYYQNDASLEFNTFHQWKEKGFSVKKGSKAFLVWGRPRQVPVKDSEDDEFKYWPLCYLFSENQVHKIDK